MTPPTLNLLKLHELVLLPDEENQALEGLFLPDLQLQLHSPLGDTANSLPQNFRLGDFKLAWNPPALWKPSSHVIQSQSTPPEAMETSRVENKTLNEDQTWTLITDILLLIESMDVKGTNMLSNGDEGGCRYNEMADRRNLEKELDKCTVLFEPKTRASVDLQLRKRKGSNESLITRFRVLYNQSIMKDEFPDNQVKVWGFEFSPFPKNPIPFYEEIDPLTAKGYSLRYIVKPNQLLQIPFIGYPIFKGVAEPNAKLDITKDFLASLGLDKEDYFQEAHSDPFKIPQSVSDFMRIIRHIETDDDKLSVVNVNKVKGRPRLFDWLSFGKIDWVSHLREGVLNIPNFGSFTFAQEKLRAKLSQSADDREEQHRILDQNSRLEIRATQQTIEASLVNIEMKEAHFSIGQHDIVLKGLKAGKISSKLPGLKKLIQKFSEGAFKLEDLALSAEDLHIDEMIIRDDKNKITTHLKNAHIEKFNFDGLSHISAEGISADLIKIGSEKLSMGLHIQGAKIPKVTFEHSSLQDSLVISRIEGKNTQLDYSNTHLQTQRSTFENLKWIENASGSHLTLQSLQSAGSLQYQAASGVSFETSGSSELSEIQVDYTTLQKDEAKLNVQFEIAGEIEQLGVEQNDTLLMHLSKTHFNPSKLQLNVWLDPSAGNALRGVQYDVDFNIQKTELQESKIGPVVIAPSTLQNGRIHFKQDSWALWHLPQIDVSGTLDLHIQEIVGRNESFNIPGLSVSGKIRNIRLEGPAHFFTTPSGWTFEKISNEKEDALHAQANIEGIEIIHDPHKIPDKSLFKWAFNHVVKTDLSFSSANLSLEDIEKMEFALSTPQKPTDNSLQLVRFKNIRVDNIQASGVAWAKFPLFYYMRGVFPQIGTLYEGSLVRPSFISLDQFSIDQNGSGLVTTLQGLKTELLEVGGEQKFALADIPLLKIAPQSEVPIDTGNHENHIHLFLIDKPRGGYIKLKSVPRPLEQRHSRVMKPPSPSLMKPRENETNPHPNEDDF